MKKHKTSVASTTANQSIASAGHRGEQFQHMPFEERGAWERNGDSLAASQAIAIRLREMLDVTIHALLSLFVQTAPSQGITHRQTPLPCPRLAHPNR